MNKHIHVIAGLALIATLTTHPTLASDNKIFDNGAAHAVRVIGPGWKITGSYIEGTGKGNFLLADKVLGPGDFHLKMNLALMNLDHTAASFVMDGDHFGFDGAENHLFVEGPNFGKTRYINEKTDYITPGKPFDFEVQRTGSTLTFRIDGQDIWQTTSSDTAANDFGLRPWRSTMRVYNFSVTGNIIKTPNYKTVIFRQETDGYNNYRIPALIITKKGTLLAFAEGREAGDTGDIDTLLRRSEDGGKTWTPFQVVWSDDRNTCGNPCPVVDQTTGEIILLSTWNHNQDPEPKIIAQTSIDTRRVYVCRSRDDGKTWSRPVEITDSTKQKNWTWYATGPGVGIQLQKGKRKGRLVIPCDHIEARTKKYFSHIIYSDDHGQIWQLGGTTPTDQVNECQIVELADGTLMLNMRNYDRRQKQRAVSLSRDDGLTFSEIWHDPVLIEPICQASFLRYSLGEDDGKNRLLFSNPASENGRHRMTVRLSYDEGKTWPAARLLHRGPAAYSCLTVLPGGDIACFYEAGHSSPYETMTFERFPLAWLTAEN